MGLPARKLGLNSEKRIEEASLSLDGKRLIFLFESGEGYSVAREVVPGDDGTPITSLQIFDHCGAVSVFQASSHCYDLPWDSIRHYAQGGHPRKFALGRMLKSLRKRRGMTQQGLSKLSGISRMQLARLESDKSTPGLETLVTLCRVLGASPLAVFNRASSTPV